MKCTTIQSLCTASLSPKVEQTLEWPNAHIGRLANDRDLIGLLALRDGSHHIPKGGGKTEEHKIGQWFLDTYGGVLNQGKE